MIAGALGLLLGPATLLDERRPPHRSAAGLAYLASVFAVALTALALVAADPARLWWLAPLALLTATLALLGRLAPRRRRRGWVRAYAHGQGGSYTALTTAALVVSLDGPAATAAWIAPMLIGLPLIERRVRSRSPRPAADPCSYSAQGPPTNRARRSPRRFPTRPSSSPARTSSRPIAS